jgi:hypothetical protein
MINEFPKDVKKKIKALQDLDKHSVTEVVSRVVEALDYHYPADWKRTYEIVRKKAWNDIRAEIIQTVESQNYVEIHKLTDEMLKTDLLFNTEVIKNMKKITDMGNLAFFYDKQPHRTLVLLATLNKELKDAKIETYLLYRNFSGKPRLSNGFLKKT